MGLAHEKKSYLQEKANLFEIGSMDISELESPIKCPWVPVFFPDLFPLPELKLQASLYYIIKACLLRAAETVPAISLYFSLSQHYRGIR